ncbi:MAG: hypothetical protein RL338_398 [Chloroflexota bacterium]
MRDERTLLLGSLAIIGAAVAFGTLGVVTRFAYDAGLTPTTLAGWRAALGTLGLGTIIVATGIAGGRAIVPTGVGRREVAMLGAAALLGALVNVGIFGGLELMPVALVLLAFYTYPVIIGVVGALFLGEPLDRVRLAALALAVAGTALVVLGGIDPATGLRVDVLGLALALGAAVAQTGLSLVTRSGFRSIPSAHATAGILGGMAVVFWTSSALTGQLEALLIPFRSPDAFALVAYLGLVTAALSTFLFVVGIRLIGPLLGGILSLFDPVVAIVLAAVILGERLTGVGLAGGALVIAAAVVVQRIPVRSNHPGTGVRRDAVGQEPLPPVG